MRDPKVTEAIDASLGPWGFPKHLIELAEAFTGTDEGDDRWMNMRPNKEVRHKIRCPKSQYKTGPIPILWRIKNSSEVDADENGWACSYCTYWVDPYIEIHFWNENGKILKFFTKSYPFDFDTIHQYKFKGNDLIPWSAEKSDVLVLKVNNAKFLHIKLDTFYQPLLCSTLFKLRKKLGLPNLDSRSESLEATHERCVAALDTAVANQYGHAMFACGMHVRLKGLIINVEFNGEKGVITKYNNNQDRCQVKLLDGSRRLVCYLKNLEPLREMREEDGACCSGSAVAKELGREMHEKDQVSCCTCGCLRYVLSFFGKRCCCGAK